MKRALVLGSAGLLLTGLALAQAPLPPGASAQMPPGHPPVQGSAAPAEAAPPGRAAARTDQNLPSAELPAGVIEARINDAQGNPLPGVATRLAVLRQSVSEGDAREFKTAISGTDGKVRFDGMATGAKISYRLTVKREAAEYASSPFSLRDDVGQALVLHVYPVATDIRRVMVGMRGFVMVEPRDDVFQFEVLFRVFNVGAVTWVPDDLVIDLPRGWKGFKAQESMGDTRFVAEGDRGARLMGTFGPGQHDVVFRFQVPNQHDETVEFEMSLPPHVAEAQVMAEAAKGMGVEVSGMTPAQPTVREDGRRLLVTGRQLKPGEPEMKELSIRLTGIPTPGPARWYAAGLAIALGAFGLYIGLGGDKAQGSAEALSPDDVARAKKLLLDELVALEQARASDQIGPKTYESAHRTLIDALTRLEARLPGHPEKPRKRRAPAA